MLDEVKIRIHALRHELEWSSGSSSDQDRALGFGARARLASLLHQDEVKGSVATCATNSAHPLFEDLLWNNDPTSGRGTSTTFMYRMTADLSHSALLTRNSSTMTSVPNSPSTDSNVSRTY
ncbi:hypothetical protein EMPS_09984 [Entomortierella parvispora]|uniref:Uncharacterized protein n=1 Tax=Entomortierella parvispora TaxID=205924 RepID=A0A9P3HJ24_9FUNG|nr:hypothetical protein EMPS_09984 [Entomortierella parvispora]